MMDFPAFDLGNLTRAATKAEAYVTGFDALMAKYPVVMARMAPVVKSLGGVSLAGLQSTITELDRLRQSDAIAYEKAILAQLQYTGEVVKRRAEEEQGIMSGTPDWIKKIGDTVRPVAQVAVGAAVGIGISRLFGGTTESPGPAAGVASVQAQQATGDPEAGKDSVARAGLFGLPITPMMLLGGAALSLVIWFITKRG